MIRRPRQTDVALTGVRGVIRWHYFGAADVVAFTVTGHRDGRWSVSATITNVNDYNLAQRPLTFRAPTKFGAWVWPIETWTRRDAWLTAQLGALQRERRKETPTDAAQQIRSASHRAADYLRRGLDRRQAGIDRR